MFREATMVASLALLIPACADPSKEPGDGSNDPPGEADGGGGDDGGGTDDSGTPGCTPVDYYLDADHDGFGTGDLLSDCDPVDAADVDGDCDDGNADVHPGQEDVCNGVDDDCDLDFDEDAKTTEYFVDADGDGYGVTDAPTMDACSAPDGYAPVGGDCDDTDAARAPGFEEDWTDGVDNNCDGIVEIETPVKVPEALHPWWDAPTAGTTELRILSGYTSGAAYGEIQVFHDTPEAVVLALVSAEPANWIVTETYGGTIQKIAVSGPGASTVSAPKDVPVETYSGPDAWGYAMDFDDPGSRAIVEQAEAATGLEMTSFHAHYKPGSFTISPAKEWTDVSAYPDCSKKIGGTVGGGPDLKAIDPVACAAVLKNSHICLTSNGTTITGLGLDTGDTCTASTLAETVVDGSRPSMMWSDEYVYGCAGSYGMLMRASLLTGAVEKSWVYCGGVAGLEGQIYVTSTDFSSDATLYDTWENARCDVPSATLAGTRNTRITIQGDLLYSTWHSTNEFEWQDVSGSASGVVTLDDYDDWIWGIDVTDDNWFTFIAPDGIRWHDLDGHAIGNLALTSTPGYGLACLVQ
jgi:hypothetical protein